MAATDEQMRAFNADLDIALSEVRAVLDHWGLKDWYEYLVVRQPGKVGSYIVKANPRDKSDFDSRLQGLHEAEAALEQ